jgi:hypothetical protein
MTEKKLLELRDPIEDMMLGELRRAEALGLAMDAAFGYPAAERKPAPVEVPEPGISDRELYGMHEQRDFEPRG